MATHDTLLGGDNAFLEVLEQTSRLAQLNKPVLILGERGTGKELIAQRLHYLSPRWQGPFISLNCAALNENLLDSELFGHEAGAFTGAQRRHLGRFERADGGTLFLDELATAPMLIQEKLLRVIEYGQLERVGGSQALQVDVRLICATHADLPALAAAGRRRALPCRSARPPDFRGHCPASVASTSGGYPTAGRALRHADVPRTGAPLVRRLRRPSATRLTRLPVAGQYSGVEKCGGALGIPSRR